VCSISWLASAGELAELSIRVGFVALLSVAVLAGCFSSSPDKRCAKPKEYQKSTSLPDLKIPEGLEAPDHSATMVVPPVPPADQGGVISDCLDRPPDYFRKEKAAD
jgi:uncharacterized lipoprotein